MDSHRLSKLTSKMGDRNLKSSMVLVSKETIQTNKLTKLQSSRVAFTVGKATLDAKMNSKQGQVPQSNEGHSKMRDYSPIGEISKTRASYLNLKPRLQSQFDRGRECDESSNFSNITVPTTKPEHKGQQRAGKASHAKQPSFSIENKRRGRGG